MKRGDIFYIESAGAQIMGSEQRPGRPGIIVSNDKGNENSEVVEVVYTTTQPKNNLPTHVGIRTTPKPSIALCEQVNSVSKQRVGSYIGCVTESEQANIDIALMISLDLYIPQHTEAACGGGGQDRTGKQPDTSGDTRKSPSRARHLQKALRRPNEPDFRQGRMKEVETYAANDARAA